MHQNSNIENNVEKLIRRIFFSKYINVTLKVIGKFKQESALLKVTFSRFCLRSFSLKLIYYLQKFRRWLCTLSWAQKVSRLLSKTEKNCKKLYSKQSMLRFEQVTETTYNCTMQPFRFKAINRYVNRIS